MAFIMMTMERNMITKAIRWVFALLDWVFYNLISILMQAIFDIANFTLSEDIFEKLIDRIYLVLGIFMLFKITISLLTYLVNPDKISDKENGIGKLSLRVVLVLVMLIMIPSGFQLLNEVQNALLPTLPRLILKSSNGDDSDKKISTNGEKIATSIYGAFFYDNPDCVGGEPTGVTPYNQTTVDIDYMFNNVNLSCQTTNNGSMYQYEYTPIISTLAGGFMCYVLIGICITVAIRMFKMMILRMVAPIPVISYIDPKSSKDGAFSKWVKTLTTTWLELFINLGILYLIVFLVNSLLINSAGQLWDATQGFGFIRKSFFIVFVIMGLFAFARQAPKFIMDALGIKNQGNFMRAMGLSSVALGSLGATAGSMAARVKHHNNKGTAVVSAPFDFAKSVFSGIASVGAGGNAILSTDKPTLTTGMDAQKKYQAQNLNNIRSGYGMGRRLLSGGKSIMGYDIDNDINHTQAIVDTSKQLKEYAMGEGAKYYSDIGIDLKDTDGNVITTASRNQLLQAISLARATGQDVEVNSENLGSVDGSLISKLTGDVNEQVGSFYISGINGEKINGQSLRDLAGWTGKDGDAKLENASATLDAFTTSYANATGMTKERAKKDRIPQIKKNQKSNETKVFTLKQEKGPKR